MLRSDRSQFVNCEFKWDDNFRDDTPLGAHVTLYKVYGVSFLGCDFHDTRTAAEINGIGIYSLDAKYRVIGRCLAGPSGDCSGGPLDPNWDEGTFWGLKTGIRAYNSHTLNSFVVDHCAFYDCVRGVDAESVDHPQVTRNLFSWITTPDYENIGVRLLDAEGITVEENAFENSSTSGDRVIGVITQNLGETNERIYKNTYHNLTYANVAIARNRSVDNPLTPEDDPGKMGLYFGCNNNSNNYYDHFVMGTGGIEDENLGVKKINGTIDLGAGNTFSSFPDPNGSYWNGFGAAEDLQYWYNTSNTPVSSGGIAMLNSPGFTLLNNCPSELIVFEHIIHATVSQLDLYKFNLNKSIGLLAQKEQELANNLLTPNEIAQFMSMIQNLSRQNNQQVRQKLAAASPYLTKDMFYALFNVPSNIFPETWIKDLAILNIHFAREPQFYSDLAADIGQQLMNHVNHALKNTQSSREILEAEIDELRIEKAFNANMILTSYKNDTVNTDYDSLEYYIDLKNEIHNPMRKVDLYLTNNEYSSAGSELNNISANMNNFYPVHQQEFQDFYSLKTFLLGILQVPGQIENLPENDLNTLRGFAQNGIGRAQLEAQHILCFFYNECYEYQINWPQGSRAPESYETVFEDPENAIEPSFSVYPNPASELVTIQLDNLPLNGSLLIRDLTGKIIEQTQLTNITFNWNTSEVENGIYLITFSDESGLQETQKVIIQH